MVIADDLTGACDTGVHFARQGFATTVTFGGSGEPEPVRGVRVINTRSRSQAAAEAAARVERAIASVPDDAVLYKKIDSTLCGHIAVELEAALRVGTRRSAVFAPAYPAMGRIVRDGTLLVDGVPRQEILGLFEQRGIRVVPDIQAAASEPATVYAPDAATEDDLRQIAAAALPYRDRLILVGSGGLAREMAPLLAIEAGLGAAQAPEVPRRSGPVLFFIGSHNPVTLRQVKWLDAAGLNCRVKKVRLSEGSRRADNWRRALEAARAILFCGGESAQLVCGTLGASGMALKDEIVPGVPWGILRGGICDGLPAATKAGGFGTVTALADVARWFLKA